MHLTFWPNLTMSFLVTSGPIKDGRFGEDLMKKKYVKNNISRIFSAVLVALTLTACGTPSPQTQSNLKIAGGIPVPRNDKIARSTVFFVDPDGNIGCSGVIVGPNQVASAAHCWGDDLWPDVHVAFATSLAEVRFDEPYANTRRVISAIRHEGYQENFSDPKTPPFDISLVTFEGPIPRNYQPATVFSSSLVVPDGLQIVLAGYGTTGYEDGSPRILRAVVSKLGSQNLRKKEFYFGQTPGYGACGGDSGGPAYFRNSQGDVFLLGTASRGTPDVESCLEGKSIYTDIRFYQDWLEQRGNFAMKVQTHFIP